MSNTLNIELKLDTTINFSLKGFTVHSFIDIGDFQTDKETEVTISYQDVIAYNLDSALYCPNTEEESLDPNSEEYKQIKSEIDSLKGFIESYENRVNKAISNYK